MVRVGVLEARRAWQEESEAALARVRARPQGHGGEKPGGWTLRGEGVSQPKGSTEQPNPPGPDVTSSPRPGPAASPSPSLLPVFRGQHRRRGLAQLCKDHPTLQPPGVGSLGPTPRLGFTGSPTPTPGSRQGNPGPGCPWQAASLSVKRGGCAQVGLPCPRQSWRHFPRERDVG